MPDTEGLERPIFAEVDRRWGNRTLEPSPLVGVTDDKVRVFIPLDDPEKTEFYDWSDDPGEQNDRAAERAEDIANYRRLADDYISRDEPPWGVDAGTVELKEMQLNQLKALGYRIE